MIETRLNEYLKALEQEVMQIIAAPSMDRKQKNLLMKPLVSKKKIIQNTIDALALVDRVHQEEMEKAGFR